MQRRAQNREKTPYFVKKKVISRNIARNTPILNQIVGFYL